MFTKITHITLFVNNQDEALAFYQKLGFSVHTDAAFGDMRWLTLNLPERKDLELVILLAETSTEKALVGKQASDKPFISFETNNAQEAYNKLKALNVTDLTQPEDQPWGVSFSFKDLYGNGIYVCQPK